MYFTYVLKQSNAASGRYDKDSLQYQALRMPHAKITMVANDIMIGNVPLLPDDMSLVEWAETRVLHVAGTATEWISYPFMVLVAQMKKMSDWPEWSALDAIYMPQGLEPCLNHAGEVYECNGKDYALVDMRFMPETSFDYKRA